MKIVDSIWIIWALSEVYFNVSHRSKTTDSKEKDKNSYLIIWAVIAVSVTSSILITNVWNFPVLRSDLLKYIGAVLIIAGVIVRYSAVRTLGKFFTVNLAIDNEHKLINTGLYKYIRHPAYSGSLLSFVGLALNTNNWVSMPIILLPVLAVFIFRINIEEKLLLQQPDLNYAGYMKSTKRLIPFVY